MKIAIACYNLGWLAGGPRLIFSLAKEWQNLGHEVTIYAPDYNPEVYPDLTKDLRIKSVKLPEELHFSERPKSLGRKVWHKLNLDKKQIALARIMSQAIDPDVDVLNPHDYAYLIAPFYRKINPKARTLWQLNDPPYMYLPKADLLTDLASRIYNWSKDMRARRFFKYIDEAIVVNERNRVWAEARGMRAKIVRPGVNFEEFYAPVKWRASNAPIKLLSVGAPNPYRRFEDTLLAAAALNRERIDARATIIGKNIWGENAYCDHLKEIARKNQIGHKVDFHFEGVSDAELKSAYRNHDVYVVPIHLPPPRNGFGWQLTIFEAMAAGLPVVLSRANDNTEVLTDGTNALFVDPMSPDQIAAQVRRLAIEPVFYHEVASAGQNLVKDKFSWRHYAENYLA